MNSPTQPIEIRLPEEGLLLEGTLAPWNDRLRAIKYHSRNSLRFRCPCGMSIDTSTMDAGDLHRFDSGYLVQCSGCRRWYFHNLRGGYVEGVQADRNVIDSLFQRMPEEYGFIRGILAAPNDADLREGYADFLSQRGDSRAEVLQLKRQIASIGDDDPQQDLLRAKLESLRSALDPEWFALLVRMTPAALCLVGADNDIAELPQRLQTSMINVRSPGEMRDGDYVVFCVSSPDGPLDGTRAALDRCRGRNIIPIGIALTNAELVSDVSLQALVTFEERDLICGILPAEVVDSLPVFYDFDPWLAEKILTCICDTQ